MTTTPAPLDLDEMAKLAAPITDGTTWKVEYHETQQVWVIRSGPECVAECFDKEEALALVGIRNNWPALLDELATERRQGAAMASITGEAIRQIGEERDAAREELAKTRANRDEMQRALIQTAGWQAEAERNRDHWKEQYDEQLAATRRLDDMRMREIGELNRELAKTRAELATANAHIARVRALADTLTMLHPQDVIAVLNESGRATGGPVTNPPAIGEDGCVLPHVVTDTSLPADTLMVVSPDGRVDGSVKVINIGLLPEPNQTCGFAFVGNEGEFTCDLYDPHPGKHWNSLAEFAWTAEPADEPKATVDLADPNACRHCGINEQDHANRWTETVGWHTWVDPGNEVRKTRMLLRRQNRKPAAS